MIGPCKGESNHLSVGSPSNSRNAERTARLWASSLSSFRAMEADFGGENVKS